MANFRYTHPQDEVLAAVTPTVFAGMSDPDYPVANLGNGTPALPAKFTTAFVTLRWDLTTPTVPAWLQIIHANLGAGTATWRANAASDFSGAGETYAAVLTALDVDGYHDDIAVLPASPTARRYWELAIAGNDANVVIGELWGATAVRALTHDPAKGVSRPERRLTVEHVTPAGVQLEYDMGMREEGTQKLVITTTRGVGEAGIRTLYRAARGGARPFVVLDSLTGRAQYVRIDQQGRTKASPSPSQKLTNELAPASASRDWSKVTLGLTQVSRGLPWVAVP